MDRGRARAVYRAAGRLLRSPRREGTAEEHGGKVRGQGLSRRQTQQKEDERQ